MKKVLIIANGILAKHFLERVVSVASDSNDYTVVFYKKKTIRDIVFPESFKIYSFDPTSFEKMTSVMNKDYYQVIIAVSKKIDAQGSYKTIRQFDKKVPIYLVDKWGLEFEDKYLKIVNSRKIVAFRLADFVPNTPIFAQNIGLAAGEVMDIQVPVGSSYIYRHIGGIEQKKWHIAALYRSSVLFLPKPNLMIQPNDNLLIVGAPEVLQDVYKSIKRELGQFPQPFGSNIYCLVDMKNMNEKRIETLLANTLALHERLNSKKLYIKIINPTYSFMFSYIKNLASDDIDVSADYYNILSENIYINDVNRLNIGLCVVDKPFFKSNVKTLFNSQTPIFKIADNMLENIKTGIVFSGNTDDIEKHSSVIFDLSAQLDLKVQFYDFDPEVENQELAEHFENIAKLYEKQIEIIKNHDKNPIFKLKKEDNILQFVPFYESFTKSKIISMFSEDLNRIYFLLNDKYQLFLPILE
ncbi:MAG: potassium transporter TrkA [Campylobacteraceae bacterium]|jgi:hypothetical protein|nr:potassium transporter TrkA [Campylobacteraceae bacterium]